ncbi:cytosolic carboxypeptidase 6-like [Sylvia atricapilla]|uniref:cytosolic carboxypeptidase 6-like n=1 Tax=Sylvia atricapilla TaxID=48155 RepID=UPI00339A16DF
MLASGVYCIHRDRRNGSSMKASGIQGEEREVAQAQTCLWLGNLFYLILDISVLVLLVALRKINLEFYIDIHAHSTMMNGFMYGNIFEDEERFQRQAVFPKLLCQNAEDFSYSSTSFNRDAVKAGTGRRFLGGLLNDTSYCYTLEVSFYSYILGGTAAAVPYTEEAYMKLGRNVARTFLDYYRLNSLVEGPLAPTPKTRKDNVPSYKCTAQRGPGNSHAGAKPEKRSQAHLKDPSLSMH